MKEPMSDCKHRLVIDEENLTLRCTACGAESIPPEESATKEHEEVWAMICRVETPTHAQLMDALASAIGEIERLQATIGIDNLTALRGLLEDAMGPLATATAMIDDAIEEMKEPTE